MIKLNYRKLLIFTGLFILNAMLKDSMLSFVLTGIQVVMVLYFLFGNKINDATYWHFIFMATSFAVSGTGEEEVLKTGYFSTKLVGPITLSYVIAILLCLISYSHRKNRTPIHLFDRMRKVFLYFLVSGVFLGSIGCFFFDYFSNVFVGYTVYITLVLIHVIILENLYSQSLLKEFYDSVIPLLTAALISTIFNWIAGMTREYSIYEMVVSSSVSYFSIILILFLNKLSFNVKVLIVCLLFVYLFILVQTGAPGKFFINASVIGLVLVINRIKHKGFGFIPALGLVAVMFVFASVFVTEDSLFFHKFQQYTSIGVSLSSGRIDDAGSSPYIRIASMLNIYYENINNPLYFFLGRGYGGYFHDSLHLFSGLDLTVGAFSDEAVRLGKFPTAHSTFNTIPLLNGFIGFFLILQIVYSLFKRSMGESPLSIAGILWLLFMFYYNIQMGVIGVLLIFASEYEMQVEKVTFKRKKENAKESN